MAEPRLDAATRQAVVELAFAGAQHGMHGEARTILGALPSLVAERDMRQWLHIALLIALGEVGAAQACLARVDAADERGMPSTEILVQWLAAMAPFPTDGAAPSARLPATSALASAPSLASPSAGASASPRSFSSLSSSPSASAATS
jgi:type III secretion system SsaH family protein